VVGLERRCYGREYNSRGYRVTVRTARESHPCWYCRSEIRPGSLYVEVKGPNRVAERYHVDCFNLQYMYTGLGVMAVDTPQGATLCEA
jgi:hypothetical protein